MAEFPDDFTELATTPADDDQLLITDSSAGQEKRIQVSNLLGGVQPLDADLTTIAAANNGSVLAATTASFTTADESKLDGIEAGADVTDTANVAAAGGVIGDGITDIVRLTQAAYDLIGSPDANTLYVIVG